MFIILTYTATIFDKMIIAGAASIIARGVIERDGGVEVLWSRWFLACLPCDLITIVVAWRLTLYFYPPEKPTLPGGVGVLQDAVRRLGPWNPLEKRAALLMAAAIVLWTTDFIHHIAAPMIGLGIGLVATLPGIGVLDTDDVKRVNYLPIFFVAAAVSMGQGVDLRRGREDLRLSVGADHGGPRAVLLAAHRHLTRGHTPSSMEPSPLETPLDITPGNA